MPSKSKSIKKRILKKLGLYKSPPPPLVHQDQLEPIITYVPATMKKLEEVRRLGISDREDKIFKYTKGKISSQMPLPSKEAQYAMERYSFANVAGKTKKRSPSQKGGKRRKHKKTAKKSCSWW